MGKRYERIFLSVIVVLPLVASPLLSGKGAGTSWAGPAELYDIESIKNMTLSDLEYEETERDTIGDEVVVILGDWSNGEWDTFDTAGNPRTITLHQRAALYLPIGVPCTTEVGLIKAAHESNRVESEDIAKVASLLGIPILAHGEYSIDWDTLGYRSRNRMLAASLENIVRLNRIYPVDFITGNYFWVLPHTDMCAVTLLQRLAEQEGWIVERVGLEGGSKEGYACWIACAVDDRIETAGPGGYQFEDFVYGFRCYETDWNWENYGKLGPIMGDLRAFYNWLISTPAGEAAESYFSVEKFKESLYPRVFCISGDVTLYGMHDADYYPLGAESPFLDGFTEKSWRYNRRPNERRAEGFRQKRFLYLTGAALFKSDEEIEELFPKVIGVEVHVTGGRKFSVQAYVSGNPESVRLWWSHSETRRWNEEGQAPWVSAPMEKQAGEIYFSEWQQAPEDEEIAYYVEAETWYYAEPYRFPCRDASSVQFLWRIPKHTVGVGVERRFGEPGPGACALPANYALSRSYPNPFNATTVISYQLALDGHVKLEVYNLLGQKVATLVDEQQQAGYKSVIWQASLLSSGLYFCRLTAGDFCETRRMMLVK